MACLEHLVGLRGVGVREQDLVGRQVHLVHALTPPRVSHPLCGPLLVLSPTEVRTTGEVPEKHHKLEFDHNIFVTFVKKPLKSLFPTRKIREVIISWLKI